MLIAAVLDVFTIEPVTAACLADVSRVLVGTLCVTAGCLGLSALAIVAIVSRCGWPAVGGDVLDGYVEPFGDVPNVHRIADLNDPVVRRQILGGQR